MENIEDVLEDRLSLNQRSFHQIVALISKLKYSKKERQELVSQILEILERYIIQVKKMYYSLSLADKNKIYLAGLINEEKQKKENLEEITEEVKLAKKKQSMIQNYLKKFQTIKKFDNEEEFK